MLVMGADHAVPAILSEVVDDVVVIPIVKRIHTEEHQGNYRQKVIPEIWGVEQITRGSKNATKMARAKQREAAKWSQK